MNNLQLENQWLRDKSDGGYGAYLLNSVWNLLGKTWFEKCAQKGNFHDKNLWHIVLICTRRFWWLATHQPSHPKKHAISGVQSGWAATYLADSVPSVTLQGRCALQNVDPVVMQHTGLPSSGLVEFYVRQVVCVCFYSLCKNMYYTCNIEYTARWVCPASRLAPTLPGP